MHRTKNSLSTKRHRPLFIWFLVSLFLFPILIFATNIKSTPVYAYHNGGPNFVGPQVTLQGTDRPGDYIVQITPDADRNDDTFKPTMVFDDGVFRYDDDSGLQVLGLASNGGGDCNEAPYGDMNRFTIYVIASTNIVGQASFDACAAVGEDHSEIVIDVGSGSPCVTGIRAILTMSNGDRFPPAASVNLVNQEDGTVVIDQVRDTYINNNGVLSINDSNSDITAGTYTLNVVWNAGPSGAVTSPDGGTSSVFRIIRRNIVVEECDVTNLGILVANVVNPGDDPADIGGDDDGEEIEHACTESFPRRVAWAICAGLSWVDTGIEYLTDTMNELLSVDPAEVNTDGMREAWSYFRNIASVLLVIIGLVMIIGQAVSKE